MLVVETVIVVISNLPGGLWFLSSSLPLKLPEVTRPQHHRWPHLQCTFILVQFLAVRKQAALAASKNHCPHLHQKHQQMCQKIKRKVLATCISDLVRKNTGIHINNMPPKYQNKLNTAIFT
eukprot:4691377-Amphidinium_carterae.1